MSCRVDATASAWGARSVAGDTSTAANALAAPRASPAVPLNLSDVPDYTNPGPLYAQPHRRSRDGDDGTHAPDLQTQVYSWLASSTQLPVASSSRKSSYQAQSPSPRTRVACVHCKKSKVKCLRPDGLLGCARCLRKNQRCETPAGRAPPEPSPTLHGHTVPNLTLDASNRRFRALRFRCMRCRQRGRKCDRGPYTGGDQRPHYGSCSGKHPDPSVDCHADVICVGCVSSGGHCYYPSPCTGCRHCNGLKA